MGFTTAMNFNHVRQGEDYTTLSWWKNRTAMEKRLVIVTTITCFVILSLLITLLVTYSGRVDACVSSSCVKATNEILMFVDKAEDPCNDFYQFTCGNFLKDARLDDHKSTTMKDIMDNILINQIKQMIEEPIKKVDSPSFGGTKSFYRACMNESGIDSQGLKIMKDILKDIGGWPTLDSNWKKNDFDWKRATNKLRMIGYTFEFFLRVQIGVNQIHENNYIIEIKPPDLKLLEIKERYKDLYRSYAVDLAVLLGATRSRADREVGDVLDFQEALRKVVKKSEERGRNDDSYNPRTISNLHYEIPEMTWFDYINGLLSPSAKITSEENVHVSDVVYIKEMLSLFNRADKRVIANFMALRFVLDFVDFLPKQFRERKRDYMERSNQSPIKSRWEICLGHAENIMPVSLKDLFVQKHISKDVKDNVREMINNLKKRFDKRIDKFDWLDEKGIEFAKEKIASVRDYVADYGEGHDDKAMEDVYNEVQIHEDKFLLSLLNLTGIKQNLKYRRLHQHVLHDREENHAVLYSMDENILKIPVDYLHDIYYDINRPGYLNYGAIGSIIGRELSNMFLEGRHHDVRGNLREFSTSESLLNYHNRTRCFWQQYERFYIPEIGETVNKSLAHIQDIAELAGKKFAYEAYGVWVANNEIERTLPGLDYTQKQLFWISSALYQCTKNTRYDTEQILTGGKQSLKNFMVNGPLRNIREFAADFGCPIGSKMNPTEKCDIWEV